MVLILHT